MLACKLNTLLYRLEERKEKILMDACMLACFLPETRGKTESRHKLKIITFNVFITINYVFTFFMLANCSQKNAKLKYFIPFRCPGCDDVRECNFLSPLT